jgi:hypothetical protein
MMKANKLIFLGVVTAVLATLAAPAIDLDGGGCSDAWEQQLGSGPLVAGEDPDNDGFPNYIEYYFGTNPLVNNLSPTHTSTNGSGEIEITFYGPIGMRFQVQRTTDLTTGIWEDVGDLIVGENEEIVYTDDPTGIEKSFYRVKADRAEDQDGDDLDAFEEFLLGTSDANSDSDFDGMPDDWEWTHGLNPLGDDSAGDPDNDGRTNLDEYQLGSDPNEYYNGQAPQVSIADGSPQVGNPEQFFAKALTVQVRDQFSDPLVNAPVTFTVTGGDAQVSTTNSGSPILLTTVEVHTNEEGKAFVFLRAGDTLGSAITVEAVAGTALALEFSAVITEVPFPTFGLQAWFRADQGIQKDGGDRVTQWSDSTGLGNNATAVSGQEPLWRDDRLNDKPTVYFDGDNESLQFPQQNKLRTVFLAIRHDTGSQDHAVALGGQSSYEFHGGNGTAFLSENDAAPSLINGEGFVNGNPTAPTSILKPKLFRVISFITADNVLADQIGQDRNITNRAWLGDIAEIILYDDVLTSGDRALVEEYLYAKYALVDNDVPGGDGLIDYWELEQFGNYVETGSGDFDGDGLTNEQEMNDGTDPKDYYNGQSPTLTADSGDGQSGDPSAFLAEPVVVLVRDALDQPLSNAPVTVTVDNGGQLALTNVGSPTLSTSLEVRTDASGYALVYVYTPATVPTAFTVSATAMVNGIPSTAEFDLQTAYLSPVGLSVTPDEARARFSLSWSDPSDHETGFIVERKETAAGTYAQIAELDDDMTSFTDDTAAPSRLYYYRVKAIYAAGESNFTADVLGYLRDLWHRELTEGNASSWGSFSFDNVATGTADETATAFVKQGSQSVKFDTASEHDTGVKFPAVPVPNLHVAGMNYFVFWAYAQSSNPFEHPQPKVIMTGANGYYTFTPNTTLTVPNTWQRFVIPLGGDSTWTRTETDFPDFSEIIQVEIHQDSFVAGFTVYYDGMGFVNDPADEPSGLFLSMADAPSVTVRWPDALDNETGFSIERKEGAGAFVEIHATAADVNTWTDTTVLNGETYTYRVRAILADGHSVYGPEKTVTIPTDFDADGLPDAWEREHFGNLLQGSAGNADGDDWTNGEEFIQGTGPADAASRILAPKDVLIATGYSLSDADFDDDGVSNLNEQINGTNMFEPDTDGDDVNDGADDYPLDPTRTTYPGSTPGDTTGPAITLELPVDAELQ